MWFLYINDFLDWSAHEHWLFDHSVNIDDFGWPFYEFFYFLFNVYWLIDINDFLYYFFHWRPRYYFLNNLLHGPIHKDRFVDIDYFLDLPILVFDLHNGLLNLFDLLNIDWLFDNLFDEDRDPRHLNLDPLLDHLLLLLGDPLNFLLHPLYFVSYTVHIPPDILLQHQHKIHFLLYLPHFPLKYMDNLPRLLPIVLVQFQRRLFQLLELGDLGVQQGY